LNHKPPPAIGLCVRNHFFECQLLDTSWIKEMVKDLPPRPADEANYETSERVAERHVGSFASLPAPNGLCDGFGWPGMRIMHCCSGNAVRSIYYLWNHILGFEQGTVRVNLLLNRASPWMDLASYVPYEGRVALA
jgi:hypothetical protein